MLMLRPLLPALAGLALVATPPLRATPADASLPAIPSGLPEVRLPSRLTLDGAMQLFEANGLDLLIADAAVESARGDERIARAIANPAVGGGWATAHHYDPGQCPDLTCSSTQWTANASDQGAIVDWLSGKRHLRIETAKAALEAARHSRADAERTLGEALKQQYLAAALAQSGLVFARESAETSERTLRLVEVRYRAGAVSEADSARAEAAKLETDQAVDEARQALRQARVGLAFLLGVRGEVPDFAVGDELVRLAVPAALVGATPESLLATARAQRRDLMAIESQRLRATTALALARRQRFPDVQLSFNYTQQGTGQSAIQPPTAGVSASLTIPVFYQYQGEVAKAEADLRTQELQWAKIRAQVRSDVETGFAAFEGSHRRAERMESRLLGSAERARELVGIQYEKGAASLLELLDAQRTVIATRMERLQDLDDYWSAVFALEAAVGQELRP